MAPRRSSEDKTSPLSHTSRERVGRASAGGPTVSLLLYHRAGAEVVEMSPGTPLVVGREAPADVIIQDASLSRQHALFVLRDGGLLVEDLGSTNGTFVRGEAVERASLRIGEPVSLGSVVASAHVQSPLEPALQGLDSHDSFCAALDHGVVEADYFDEPLSLVMVRADGADETAHVSRWHQRVREALRAVDRVALYSADTLEVLTPRANHVEAVEQARQLVRAARGGGAKLLCGVACYPRSAGASERLFEVCRAALASARADQPVALAPAEKPYSLIPPAEPTDERPQPIAESPAMRALLSSIERVAAADIPVLLCGETGTGKEVWASVIHARGPRRDKPFVCVNCAAIPSQLVESTLFGHVRGAFTGADQASEGVFGAADGGVVLLDEIAELSLDAQASLLRVLESGLMARVGSPEEIAVDVRVLAATHRDLESMCELGTFRSDLLYRLNAVTLVIPPLRERVDEIPLLARRFLATAAGSGPTAIDDAAMRALERYRWPGNLRELRNVIERAVVIAEGDDIGVRDLPERVVETAMPKLLAPMADEDDAHLDLKARVKRYEMRVIVQALRAEDGNQTKAARRLRVPLRTLVHKIKGFGIRREDYDS